MQRERSGRYRDEKLSLDIGCPPLDDRRHPSQDLVHDDGGWRVQVGVPTRGGLSETSWERTHDRLRRAGPVSTQATLPSISDAVTLGQIAAPTEELYVADTRRSTLREWDHVVELQVFAFPTLNATPAVPGPDGSSDVLWHGSGCAVLIYLLPQMQIQSRSSHLNKVEGLIGLVETSSLAARQLKSELVRWVQVKRHDFRQGDLKRGVGLREDHSAVSNQEQSLVQSISACQFPLVNDWYFDVGNLACRQHRRWPDRRQPARTKLP